jgi:hypothetical protein
MGARDESRTVPIGKSPELISGNPASVTFCSVSSSTELLKFDKSFGVAQKFVPPSQNSGLVRGGRAAPSDADFFADGGFAPAFEEADWVASTKQGFENALGQRLQRPPVQLLSFEVQPGIIGLLLVLSLCHTDRRSRNECLEREVTIPMVRPCLYF